MRQLQELVEQAELVHDLERRGMDGVAAEIAQEVAVLLQHDDVDAGARQQEAQHHARRPAAGDAALRGDGLIGHRCSSGVFVCGWVYRSEPPGKLGKRAASRQHVQAADAPVRRKCTLIALQTPPNAYGHYAPALPRAQPLDGRRATPVMFGSSDLAVHGAAEIEAGKAPPIAKTFLIRRDDPLASPTLPMTRSMPEPPIHPDNAAQAEFWSGPVGQRWLDRRQWQDAMLGRSMMSLDVGLAARGERVIDVGCGCGATAFDFALRVAPGGEVVGIDVRSRCSRAPASSSRRTFR